MTLADVFTRRNIVALALTSLIAVATAFAQDAPATSSTLIIQPGTVLTVRANEALSSDHNQPGDVFSATLSQPVVVHGIVVAQRGQNVAGRVVEAKRAGMIAGVSRLKVALTGLTLVDGQNVPLQSQLLVRNGNTSAGRDAAAIGTTTGVGAAIGAGADWGRGAAIGAGAGAAAGTLGVLLTRGQPTVIYPETLLTFQVTQPVTVHTEDAPDAFHAINPDDYARDADRQQEEREQDVASAGPYPDNYAVYYAQPYPYYYPYYYPYPYPYYYGYGPYNYGPSFSLFFGYPGYYRYRHFGPRYYGWRYGSRFGPRFGSHDFDGRNRPFRGSYGHVGARPAPYRGVPAGGFHGGGSGFRSGGGHGGSPGFHGGGGHHR